MPYKLDGNCVKKQDGESVPGGCHKNHEEAVSHLRALEANVKDSSIVEFSMRITKAAYNKSESAPMKWVAIDSDTDSDLYQEKMSIELYRDFVSRIENKTPVPEAFREAICESGWCGEMPYLSIAHYKAGTGLRNVPGTVESVFIDGNRLKSKGTLSDTPMGRKVWDALREDLYMQKSDTSHLPVRISIGFLDLQHKHLADQGGQEFVFDRTAAGQICPMCAQGIGNKVYTKGQLVHLAMTRVPANPRTEMSVEKSMDEITTKKQDAESIIGELAEGLEEKSIANDVLVVRSEDGSMPRPDPNELTPCYDPNTNGWNQDCINSVMDKYMANWRDTISTPVKSTTEMTKSLLDALSKSVETLYKSNGLEGPITAEATMDKVEKMSLGGTNVPEKPFSFTQDGVTVTGDGNNNIPNPLKAETKDEPEAEDNKKEEAMEKSALDNAFETLKSLVEKRATVDEINQAFAGLGTEVEKAYVPEQKPVDMNNLAEVIKSAVEAAVTPLRVEIATLKSAQAGTPAQAGNVVKSKALSLNNTGMKPNDLIQRAVPQPTRKLSQIEQIARKSTGVL